MSDMRIILSRAELETLPAGTRIMDRDGYQGTLVYGDDGLAASTEPLPDGYSDEGYEEGSDPASTHSVSGPWAVIEDGYDPAGTYDEINRHPRVFPR